MVQCFLQKKLNEIRLWSEKVRNFDRVYATDNGLFLLDCTSMHERLLPKLTSICKELCVFVTNESTALSKKFIKEIQDILTVSACYITFYK